MAESPLTPPESPLRTGEMATLSLILAAGLAARFWNIGWGLPELFEEAFPFRIASKFWDWSGAGNDFNPHFFNYPALAFYLHFLVQAVHYGVGHLLGTYPTLEAFGNSLPSSIIVGRTVSVLFDGGTICLAFSLARRLGGTRAAIGAALLVAVNPLQIREAHLINVDTPLAFLAMVALLRLHHLRERPTNRNYLLAGIAIGLATATKYTGAYLLPAFAVAHLLRVGAAGSAVRSFASRSFLQALLAAGAVFFLANPYILLSPGEFWNDFSFEQYHMGYGHLGLDTSQSAAAFYLLGVLPANLGWALWGICVVSMAALLLGRDRPAIVTIAFPAIALVVLSTWEMRADRYILPLLPPMIVLGSVGMARGWDLLADRVRAVSALARVGVPVAAALLLAVPLLGDLFAYQRGLSLPDTRTVAKEWMARALPRGSAYATGPFGIEFPRGTYATVDIPFSPTGTEGLAPFYDARWYEDLDLLVTSDYDYARFAREPGRFREILAYYDTLRAHWSLVHSIVPSEGQNGPTFWFYRATGAGKEFFDDALFRHLGILAETTLVVNFTEKLAYALFGKGKLVKSEQLLRVALSLTPESTRLLKELAYTLHQRSAPAEALEAVTRSLTLNPNQPEVVALQGSILRTLGREAEAEAALRRSLTMNGRLELPYQELEAIYERRGERRALAEILSRHRLLFSDGTEGARLLDARIDSLRKQ